MKTLPSGLQDFLDAGETTMVHCWKIIRKDSIVQGFTEHDENLTFDDVTYLASSGFSATQIESSLGLSVDNLNADGAISDDTINEDDLAAGRYDDASVELFWVNFNNLDQRILLSKGNIGKVKRGEFAFSAELRSQTNRLQQRTGRSYQRTCDAILGDARCTKNLSSFRDDATISSVENNRRLTLGSLANGETPGFYSLGLVEFLSGLNTGLKFEIKSHLGNLIVLWEKPPFTVAIDDTVRVTAGCDKSINTCHTKFENTINFQGFNLIPGSDYIVRYSNRDSTQTGASIFND